MEIKRPCLWCGKEAQDSPRDICWKCIREESLENRENKERIKVIYSAAKILGSIKSSKKSISSKKNGSFWKRPHFKKCAHFEKIYPYLLQNNEWKKKFPIGITATGRIATYNPDYFCPTTGFFIEVSTSKPNISEQGWKWKKVIRDGIKLKVFWWEGGDITSLFQ